MSKDGFYGGQDSDSIQSLEAQHGAVQEKLKNNPKLAAKIKPMQDQVDKEIDDVNQAFFSDEAFLREKLLRETLRDVFDDKSFNISDAEALVAFVRIFQEQNKLGPGKAGYFAYKLGGEERMLTVSALGTLELVDKYVNRLEKQLISNQLELADTKQALVFMYNRSFWGYIKLAFTKLFGGK